MSHDTLRFKRQKDYFELGQGADYVYCGQTAFRGRHNDDLLDLNDKQKKVLGLESINEIFPSFISCASMSLMIWLRLGGLRNLKHS